MSANEETALIIAARGIAVFPCRGKDTKPPLKPKAPLTPDGFYNATTDQAQIKRWWKSNPDALIGIPIEQLGAVGVDIDCHPGKPDGRPVWKELVRKYSGGIEPNYGFGQDTLSGGTLMLFKRPEGLRIPGSLAPGIDLKISGYFCTGEGYRPHKSHGFDRALPPLPSWLVDLITPKEASQEERGQMPPGDTDTSARNLVSAALRDWIAQEGGRNKAGYKLACQLRDLQLSQGEAERYMIQYRAECHPHEGHEYTEKEMLDSLRSAYNGTPRQPPEGKNAPKAPRAKDKAPRPETLKKAVVAPQEGNLQPDSVPEPPPPLEGTTEKPAAKAAKKTSWTVDELLGTEFPEMRWAVPDLIPEGLTILGGRPKVGKSWMLLQLAIATSTGGRFLGRKVEQGAVLYLALEDSARRLKSRMLKQQIPAGAPIRFELNWTPFHEGGLDQLIVEIERYNLRLVVVDTIARAFAGLDQNKNAAQLGKVLGDLQNYATQKGLAIVGGDHTRKPNGMIPNPIDDLMNTTNKTGVADAILGLYTTQGKEGAELKGTGRDIEGIDQAVKFDRQICCWQLMGENLSAGKREILEYLDTAGALQIDPLAKALRRDRGNVYHDLVDLLGSGHVSKDTTGAAVLWRKA